MSPEPNLLLIGASVRAAALSALRGDLRPWCADLFADADLRCRGPAVLLASRDYPRGFRALLEQAPAAPWMYTGGLENHPRLVGQLARLRPLWGNGPAVLEEVRSPWKAAAALEAQGVPHPRLLSPGQAPGVGRWLLKPVRGAGGGGICWPPSGASASSPRKGYYLQEYIEGPSWAAVYLGDDAGATLLGVTRQLVGEAWLHAGRFCYCGSIGPLALPSPRHQAFCRLGQVLAASFGLRGLFGVDCVLRDGIPWPVEVNPRYTASVEVLELAGGPSLVALHRAVFDGHSHGEAVLASPGPGGSMIGKAILFAQVPLTFPEVGPWRGCLENPAALWDLPAFADLPAAGTRIEAGHPILTLMCRGPSEAECLAELQRRAAAAEKILTG